MKKKENLWQMLKRLDEEAAQFNVHLHRANSYFDSAATHTKKILTKHERDMHQTITKFRKAIRSMIKKKGNAK